MMLRCALVFHRPWLRFLGVIGVVLLGARPLAAEAAFFAFDNYNLANKGVPNRL